MFGQVTQEQWDAHPSFRQELKELINHPAFKAAYSVVLAQGLKTRDYPQAPVDLVQWAALVGERKQGYLEALDNIMALTEPPAARIIQQKGWTRNQQAAQQAPPKTET